MGEVAPGLRLHYVTAGTGARVVALLHGCPQTCYEWRHVIPTLVDAGFRVVAPDYRGAGHSRRPAGGYDKRTMANDIHRLLHEQLQIEVPVAHVGHDIGLRRVDGAIHAFILDTIVAARAAYQPL